MRKGIWNDYINNMVKYKYEYRNRTICVPLFEEDKIILFDCLFIYNNLDVDSFYIYNRMRFDRKYITNFPICYSFTDVRCEDAVKYRMNEIMQKNPNVSLSEIVKITGHSSSTIVRYYMILKREIIGGGENGRRKEII